MSSKHPLRRILVVPLRFIGDTVLTVPLLRNLKRALPTAQIDVLVSKVAGPLLEPCPYVHEAVLEPKRAGDRIQLWKNYDTVLILRKSVSFALMCRMAGVRRIIGYDKQRWPKPLNYKRWAVGLHQSVRYPSLRTTVPQAQSHLQFMEALGLPPGDDTLELWTTPEDEAAVTTLLQSVGLDPSQPLAGFHGVSASHGKTFQPAQFGEALRKLQAAGYPILTTGTGQDAPVYEAISRETGVPLINLAGKTNLRQTVALYRRLKILLSVDSAPLHLATAAGTPEVVAIFGPTNEIQWGHTHTQAIHFTPVFNPLPCRPCYAKTCDHNRCRTDLSPSTIAQAVTDAVARSL